MIVMVDADIMSTAEGPYIDPDEFDERFVVSDLLRSRLIRRYLYADTGPPPELQPETRAGGMKVYPDWAVVQTASFEGPWTVVHSDADNSYSLGGVMGNAPLIAAQDVTTDAYSNLPTDMASKQRHADALAAQVAAQGVGADVFITERPFLHLRTGYSTRGVTVCTPVEALAVIGLYLRTQGEFEVMADFRFNRGLFFWVGTRELLPAAWRWFAACNQHSNGSGDPSLGLLAGSLLLRFDRSLEIRDQVHVAINQKQNNDVRDDALSALDVILVLLMAAFDVAARVAHRTLGLAGDEYQAAWQQRRNGGWWGKLHVAAPMLANVVGPGSRGDHVLTIVRLLRNSVHGAALQGVAYVQAGNAQETLVGLPPADEAALLTAMDALGGRSSWGVRATIPSQSHVEPAVIVERLFQLVPDVLNDLLERTPVERLPLVNLSPADHDPPTGGQSNPFEPWMRASIRWQLGL